MSGSVRVLASATPFGSSVSRLRCNMFNQKSEAGEPSRALRATARETSASGRGRRMRGPSPGTGGILGKAVLSVGHPGHLTSVPNESSNALRL